MPRRFSPIFTELDLAIQSFLTEIWSEETWRSIHYSQQVMASKKKLSELINTTTVLRQKD
jgi:hypothetical protein